MLIRWLVNILALLLTAAIIPGIQLRGLVAGAVAALVLGIVNALVRPVLLLLTLPLNIATLGLFTFVINALLLLLVAALVPGFRVAGFGAALLGSVVLSVVSAVLSRLIR